jgi:hypothetical protein
MTDLFLQTATTTPPAFAQMLELTAPRHKSYCDKWDFEYCAIVKERIAGEPYDPVWDKVMECMDSGVEYVVYLDADTMILDEARDLREALPDGWLGMVIHNQPFAREHIRWHYNMGFVIIKCCPESRDFIQTVKRADLHGGWDQLRVNDLLYASHSWTGIRAIDKKWNANVEDSKQFGPDTVIGAWHGGGSPEQRLDKMRNYLTSIV